MEPVTYLTTGQIAKRLRVSPEKVLGWIRRAELRAVNIGNGNRPSYRINPDDLEVFLRRREVQPPIPVGRRRSQMPSGGPLDPSLGAELAKKGKAVLDRGVYYRVWNGITLRY